MTMNMIVNRTILIITLAALVSGTGCRTTVTAHSKIEKEKHWAEVEQKGDGKLYVDPIPSESMMKVVKQGSTRFISYRIGLIGDNAITDKKIKDARNKYLQYDMQKDWMVKIKNDSIAPVFFQSLVKKESSRDEGVLVFEIPQNEEPDTLVYRDSFGPWGVQKIIMNNN